MSLLFQSYLLDPQFLGEDPIETGADLDVFKAQHAGAVAALTGQPLLTKASVRDEWDEPIIGGDGDDLQKRASDATARKRLSLTEFVKRRVQEGFTVEQLATHAAQTDPATASLIREIGNELREAA